MPSQSIHSYLDTFVNFESKLQQLRPEDFDIKRIQKFLGLAGDPAKNLKVIHIAGTKGKGSTCAFLAAILQEAGYKVGLYTSPHLHKVNERIRILDKNNFHSKEDFSGMIDDKELEEVLMFLRPFAAAIQNDGHLLTYFEVLTVAALCYFAKACVDVVVLETGLGGRLDATNAVDSMMAVLTPVSLDHTRILGATLSQIAFEKAGIIKNSRQKVVITPQEKEVMDVILSRCREFGVHPVLVDEREYEGFKMGLKGRHQRTNAAAAIEAAKLLKTMGFKISEEAVANGLKHVRWPGRFELIRKKPDVIIDCAHNEASARALAQTLKEAYPHRKVILVLGISQDKDISAVCRALKDSAQRVFLTRARHPRAYHFKEAECKDYFGDLRFEIIEDLNKALQKALKAASLRDVVLVTGSVFVVAEAMNFFKEK